MNSVGFASLLCSRLCHDLVSPVGALSNGLEILADEQDETVRVQVLDLLEQSARQTANRLQFFRLAFGAAGGFGALVDPREGQKAVEAFFSGSKVALVWNCTVPSLPKSAVKLLLNLALLAGEGLIRGGRLTVDIRSGNGGTQAVIAAAGERFLLSDAARAAMKGEIAEDELEPRTAPAYLAGIVARELGVEIAIEDEGQGETRFKIQLG